MFKIITIPTKQYRFPREFAVNLEHECEVDWGDGCVEKLHNLSYLKHNYKTHKQQVITIKNLSATNLSFADDKFITEIHGVLPKLRYIYELFMGCINLCYVDENLLINNTDHHDIHDIASHCPKLKDVRFITKLVDAVCANRILYNSYRADINQLAGWGSKVESLNAAFAYRLYGGTVNENVLSAMSELRSAEELFVGSTNMDTVYHYFKYNPKLKHIDFAFQGCNITNIDPNWLYHLPKSVVTDRDKIFDSSVKLNK